MKNASLVLQAQADALLAQVQASSPWREALHPRGEDGRFGSKGVTATLDRATQEVADVAKSAQVKLKRAFRRKPKDAVEALGYKLEDAFPEGSKARKVIDYADEHPGQTTVALGLLMLATGLISNKASNKIWHEMIKMKAHEKFGTLEKVDWIEHAIFDSIPEKAKATIKAFDKEVESEPIEHLCVSTLDGTKLGQVKGQRDSVSMDRQTALATIKHRQEGGFFFTIHNHPPQGVDLASSTFSSPDIIGAGKRAESLLVVSNLSHMYVMKPKGRKVFDAEIMKEIGEKFEKEYDAIFARHAKGVTIANNTEKMNQAYGDMREALKKITDEYSEHVEYAAIPKFKGLK